MYDFDEQQWDQKKAEKSDWRRPRQGWLIARACTRDNFHVASDDTAYLQIATGQWCRADRATLFPLRTTAIVYAKEFGFAVGKSVRIVAHRR